MFQALDAFALARIFTPLAHWYNRKTGNNQFHLAWFCFGILFVFRFLDEYLSIKKDGIMSNMFSVAVSAVVIPMYAILLISAKNADEQYGRGTTAVPPFLWGFLQLRCVFLIVGFVVTLEFGADALLQIFRVLKWSTVGLQIDLVVPIWTTALASGLYFASVKGPPSLVQRKKVAVAKLVPVRN